MIKCYCGSLKIFQECCEPVINGLKKAATAEALMRSRYSAYSIHHADYLIKTTHVSQQKYYSKAQILNWATSNKWINLKIISTTEFTVEFEAYFLDSKQQSKIHYELSNFVFENGNWFYVDGQFI
jgi:SEC-C motif-containing protein